MADALARLAAGFAPLTLAELEARAELRQRVDRKYVVPLERLESLLRQLVDSFAVLEIDGRRQFTYRTTYFDSPSLTTYRAHVQQRRRRFKCRSRHYVESGLNFFEVKLKGRRGETVKERLPSPPELHDIFGEEARNFLRERLSAHYGTELGEEFHPALHMRYSRLTLASLDLAERLTLDAALSFRGANGAATAMAPEYAIVESKSTRGRGIADRRLCALGFRPIPCSKYCLGIALTRDEVRGNEFLWLARRHFLAMPRSPLAPRFHSAEITGSHLHPRLAPAEATPERGP